MGSGLGAHQGAGRRQGRIQAGGAEGRQGTAAQPGPPAEFMEGNQGSGLNQSLLLQLPDQAAVGIILKSHQACRQGLRFEGTLAPPVIEVQPAPLSQGLQHHVALLTGHLKHHITECDGLGIHLHQSPQPVVTVDHPEISGGIAHQGHGLAAQILPPFPAGFLGEIHLAAPHLRQTDAHLSGLQGGDAHLDQAVLAVGWG